MDRDKSLLAGGPTARPSLLVVKESGRKPLFAGAGSRGEDKNKENDRARLNSPRLRSSISSNGLSRSASDDAERRGSSSSFTSPGGTRIPRPGFSSRKRLSIPEAFEIAAQLSGDDAEDQSQAMDASPSPAPRAWRERREGDENRMRKILGQDHLDTKAPSRPFSRESLASPAVPDAKPSPERTESPRRRSYYGKSRIGLGPKGPTPETATATTNGVNVDRPPSRLRPTTNWLRHLPSKDDLTNQGRIPALAPGIEDPLPSIETGGEHQEPAPSKPAAPASPEKSFAWQVEDDFTAGDLQVSDSPRIRMTARPFANRIHFDEGSEVDINSRTRVAAPGSRNTKLDEIRSREVKTGSDIPLELPQPKQRNTKIDEIREREEKVEHQIPIPDRNAPRPKNTKLDEIRQREIDGIPKRSLASIRLGEIREQNSMSRSLSPEENRPQTSRGVVPEAKASTELETKEPPRPKSAFEVGGERIPDTPVTVYKTRRASIDVHAEDGGESKDSKGVTDRARPGLLHRRNDSQDVLRRLARAASSSPAPEPEPRRPADSDKPTAVPSDPKPDAASSIPQPAADNGPRQRLHRPARDPDHSKPTVGFAGLPRSRSTDSVKSKRSSMQSEVDPTDRIEAEISLFAPADNQSEKGSIKAPSPVPESDDDKEPEATPRPSKPDPLTMPTPKVTGAYVETPATVKVEKIEVKEEKEREKERPKREERAPRPRSTSLRNKRTERVASGSDRDTASDPGTDDKFTTRTSSAGVRRRRSRSLSRRRAPLKNSARLPSVKDDLKELQRTHHIEDSTLDDLEEVILGRKAPSQDLEDLLDKLPQHPSLDDDLDFDLELDTKLNTRTNQIDPQKHDNSDLDRLTRMNNTLKNSLYGIHTAARGIERLSDQVNHKNKEAENNTTTTENKVTEPEIPKDKKPEKEHLDSEKPQITSEKMDTKADNHGAVPACATHPGAGTMSYIQIPIPHLYHRKPSFRLSLLGLLTLLFSLWYAAESTMCAMYCRPTRCGTTPCIWSVDDPTFGTAIPVKIDQWTTGGRGRILFDQVKEEVDDWIADAVDMYHGREITEVDIRGLSFEGKRQHRRRLRKKGLVKPRVESPDEKAKWDSWRKVRLEKEKRKEAMEMGYDVGDEGEEAVGGDTRVW
ncbi:hypothetical protein ACJ41O_001151 [Fusarium nematophilum]